MPYLADTNVVVRWMQPADPRYACRAAVQTLRARHEEINIAPQILTEYWALATRPVAANGLGMTDEQVAPRVRLLLRNFPLLPETDAVFTFWHHLVETHAIVGRQVYDARIVALMQAHGLTQLLTLNPTHFRRFPGLSVLEPRDI